VGAGILFICTHVFANPSQRDYDSIICSAEILVMNQDLKILLKNPLNSNVRESLKLRLKSGSNSLKWMCRKNSDENQKTFDLIRTSIFSEKFNDAERPLSLLISRIPFKFDNSYKSNPKDITDAKKIYNTYCSSCHYKDNLALPFPIYSLENMAKQQPKDEFYARMLIGIRGSEEINFRNPLSYKDIINIRNYLISR